MNCHCGVHVELPCANTQSGQGLMDRAVSKDRSASCPSLAQRGSRGDHRAPPRERLVALGLLFLLFFQEASVLAHLFSMSGGMEDMRAARLR